jgi:hypothetical protein
LSGEEIDSQGFSEIRSGGKLYAPKMGYPNSFVAASLTFSSCQGGQATRKTSPNLAHSAEKGSITIAWDSNSEPNLGGV